MGPRLLGFAVLALAASGMAAIQRATRAVVAASPSGARALPCDILLSVHPEFVQIPKKLALRAKQPETNPFIDASACREYAAAASRSLDRRVAGER